MGLRIKDRLELQLFFNGKEFPLAPINALDFLHMSCSVRIAVPMIHLRVKDAAKWLARTQDLVDGASIKVVLRVDKQTRVYNFRVHSFTESIEATGPMYTIDGYFDNVQYWFASTRKMIKGTSAAALQTIADICGIPTVIPQTADGMVWIPKNMRFHEFARFISQHGYVDEKSCMAFGLDLNGTMIYKNVAAREAISSSFHMAKFDRDAHIVTGFKPKNKSGLMNAISGYADDLFIPTLVGEDGSITDVQMTKLSQKSMVNANIHKAVQQARVLFAPIDGGNVHPLYQQAEYQNDRLSNTYSFGMELLTPDLTDVKLLDFINFVSKQPSESADRPYSGTYLVSSRVIYIQGINYYEKIEGVRHGLNATVDSQL